MNEAELQELLQQVSNTTPEIRQEKLSGKLLSDAFNVVERKGPVLYLVLPLSTRPVLRSWTTLIVDQYLWGARILFTEAIPENVGYVFSAEDFSVCFAWGTTPDPLPIQESEEPLTSQEAESLPLESVARCPHCGGEVLVTLRSKG